MFSGWTGTAAHGVGLCGCNPKAAVNSNNSNNSNNSSSYSSYACRACADSLSAASAIICASLKGGM
jgi:hypothetical protein